MKILITSDIHINSFSSYNILGDPYFRLHQFDTLAKRLLDIARNEHAKAVMIAGDFLHVSCPRPFIVNAAAGFLKKIADKLPVYITHGQHDYDSRTHMSRENSLLSLYDNIDGVQYLHKGSITLDGTSFYFQGWTPEQDFSTVEKDKFDVLIGHATINGAIMNNYGTTANGPEFANDKFKLCFMGDIHKPQTIKNIVIPGPPIQSNFGDDADNSVVVLDTKDLSWKRVGTHEDKNIKFLKFITSNNANSSVDDPYTVTRSAHRGKNFSSKDMSKTKSVDVLETIKQLALEKQLSTVHKTVMSVTSRLEDEDLDLHYTINHVTVKNFRSVKSLEWTPLNGITLIIGKIGTGKSTLVQAIKFALLGHRAPKSLVMFGEEAMSVGISITYGNIDYTITRGFHKKSGYVKYIVNGNEIESENQVECNSRIRNDLKFLDLYETLHRSQKDIYFLENHSYSERVALVSRIIRLNIIDRLKSSAERLKEPLSLKLKEQLQRRDGTQLFLNNFDKMNIQEDNTDYDALNKKSTEILSQVSMLLDIEKKLSMENSEKAKLLFARSQFMDDVVSPETLPDLSEHRISLENNILQLQNKKQDIKSLSISRSDQSSKVSLLQGQVLSINSKIKSCDEEIEKITSNICYTCNQEIDKHLSSVLTKKLLEKKSSLYKEKLDLQEQICQSNIVLNDISEDIEKKEEIITDIEKKIYSIKSEISHHDAIRQKIERLKTINDNIKTVENRISLLDDKIALFRTTISNRYNLFINNEQEALLIAQRSRDDIILYKEKVSAQDKMNQLVLDANKKRLLLETLENEITKLQNDIVSLERYIELVGPRGQVIRSILTTVSENMSDDNIRVVAFKKLSNEEIRPDFNVFLKVADNWINYDELSGGQKNFCDLFILNHLMEMAGGAGSLVLDETFSQVGFEDLEPVVDILKSMPVKHIFVVSHHENFPAYNNLIKTNFGDTNGVTTYTII